MIMAPEIILATEKQEPQTPIKNEAERLKKEVVNALPGTPQLRQEASNEVRPGTMNSMRRQLFVGQILEHKKKAREEKKSKRFLEIDQEAEQKRIERQKQIFQQGKHNKSGNVLK